MEELGGLDQVQVVKIGMTGNQGKIFENDISINERLALGMRLKNTRHGDGKRQTIQSTLQIPKRP